MKNLGKAIFGFAIVGVLVSGAYFANEAMAGGGRNVQFVPFPVQQQPTTPTAFDLLLLND